MPDKVIALIADNSEKASALKEVLLKQHKFTKNVKNADVIMVLGGDGFMLHCLHRYMDLNIPFYGINCGSVGFLLNEYDASGVIERVMSAKTEVLKPLKMTAKLASGKIINALAVNEVSLLRASSQVAKLKISVDDAVKIEELVCDGILLATPAGSTAYNLSVHGPIIPLGSNILALTPISPFRPRRWRGALLSDKAVVKIEVINNDKRPVNAVADFTEANHIVQIEISLSQNNKIQLLFDRGHSLEERIIREQFVG